MKIRQLTFAALAFGFISTASAFAEDVLFAGAGGTVGKAYQEHIFPAFEKQTGIKVTYVPGTILEGLAKVEAQRNNPSIDVVSLTDEAYVQYRQKEIFEKLTPDLVPRVGSVYPKLRYGEDFGVPTFLLTTGIAYNTKIFQEKGISPPTSLRDLWKPEFQHRSVIWTPATTTGVLFLLLTAKTFGENEFDVDAAFRHLAEIKGTVEFNKADEMTMLFQQEQAWIGWWNNIRVAQLRQAGMPVELVAPVEGTPVFTNGVALVKGAPHRENAIKLINFLMSDEGQTLIAQHIGGGPVVSEVKLDAELAARVPYGAKLQEIFVADMEAVVKNRAGWLESWAKEIEQQ